MKKIFDKVDHGRLGYMTASCQQRCEFPLSNLQKTQLSSCDSIESKNAGFGSLSDLNGFRLLDTGLEGSKSFRKHPKTPLTIQIKNVSAICTACPAKSRHGSYRCMKNLGRFPECFRGGCRYR